MPNKPLHHFLTALILLLAFFCISFWISLPRWFVLAGLVVSSLFASSATIKGFGQIEQRERKGWLRVYDLIAIIGGGLMVIIFLIFWVFLIRWALRGFPPER